MMKKDDKYVIFDSHKNYDDIKRQLQAMVLNVTFLKADGSMRDMRCTLIPECLPPFKGKKNLEESDEYMRVYDLGVHDWRSFRMDSIKRITVG